MARLKVLYPGNHTSSGNIGADIENIVRYVNASELGDNTLSELLLKLFDTAGTVTAAIELRNDATLGFQYRVGTYTDQNEGWITLSTVASLRGASGVDVGTIGAPLFSGRQDFTATSGQTVFNFGHIATDALLVYINGTLQAAANISSNTTAGTVTLSSGATTGDLVAIFKVQNANTSGYSRTETTANANQAVFPYVHTAAQSIMVYRNGVMQREGSSNDYTTNPASSTITFTSALSAGDIITFLRVEDTSSVKVSGLMTEDAFTDVNGFIPFTKLSISDAQIPQAKVADLATTLANRGRVYVSGSTPASANAGDMWVDTAASPNVLKFYNGTGWLLTSPDTGIPAFTVNNALQFLRVNSTGGGLEFSDIDLTGVVPKTYIGAASGVAGLDASSNIPVAQLPQIFATRSYFKATAGAISNGDIVITRAYKQTVRIDAIAAKTSGGTCSIQLKVNGIQLSASDLITVSSTLSEQNLGASVQVDATTSSKEIAMTVSSSNSAQDLEITIAAVILNV